MSNKTYDKLKLVALIAVPTLAFIASLCSIWNVPHSEQITSTLTAIDTLIGAVVVIVAREYHKPIPMDITGLQYIDADDEEIEGVEVDE